jgi:hypothetical protein
MALTGIFKSPHHHNEASFDSWVWCCSSPTTTHPGDESFLLQDVYALASLRLPASLYVLVFPFIFVDVRSSNCSLWPSGDESRVLLPAQAPMDSITLQHTWNSLPGHGFMMRGNRAQVDQRARWRASSQQANLCNLQATTYPVISL